MNISEARRLLDRVSIKGYKLQLQVSYPSAMQEIDRFYVNSGYSPDTIRVQFDAEDSHDPGHSREFTAYVPIAPLDVLDAEGFMNQVKRTLVYVATHEIDETLLLDGRIYDDPHTPERPKVWPEPFDGFYLDGLLFKHNTVQELTGETERPA